MRKLLYQIKTHLIEIKEEHRWGLVLIYGIMLAILVGGMYRTETTARKATRLAHQNKELVRQNKQRIIDIQQSRISSCKQTYDGIRLVFLPFFPAKHRTPEQQRNLDKLNRTVNRLKAKCHMQVRGEK